MTGYLDDKPVSQVDKLLIDGQYYHEAYINMVIKNNNVDIKNNKPYKQDNKNANTDN